ALQGCPAAVGRPEGLRYRIAAGDSAAGRRGRGPPRLERGAIGLGAAPIDARDLPRVADCIERIWVEDEEVGRLAGRERAEVGEPENLGRGARAGGDRLRRRQAGLHQKLELDVRGEAEVAAAG